VAANADKASATFTDASGNRVKDEPDAIAFRFHLDFK